MSRSHYYAANLETRPSSIFSSLSFNLLSCNLTLVDDALPIQSRVVNIKQSHYVPFTCLDTSVCLICLIYNTLAER